MYPYPPGTVDTIAKPGATIDTGDPKFEKDARVSAFVDAPTARTFLYNDAYEAGHTGLAPISTA
jgi:hypothetical protein